VAAVIAAGLTGAAATTALSQGMGFGPGHWHGRFMGGMLDPAMIEDRADRMVRHVAIEIDATTEQQDKLRALVKGAVKDLVPMRAKAQAARAKARELLTQQTVDRAEIERFRTEQIALADAFSKRVAQASARPPKSSPPSSGASSPTACRRTAARGRTGIGDKARSVTERILLIEDDPRLAEMVKNYLGEAGFAVTVSSHGIAGIALEAREPFDALVLDLMLPDIDGLEVCRPHPRPLADADPDAHRPRRRMDRVVGLEIGADDYLPKPFEPREMLARLRAILRRRGPRAGQRRCCVSAGWRSTGRQDRAARRRAMRTDLVSVHAAAGAGAACWPGDVARGDHGGDEERQA
jgi:CheY-like chemotaxis protein/Spy/CpxP family protein refolding chaperone